MESVTIGNLRVEYFPDAQPSYGPADVDPYKAVEALEEGRLYRLRTWSGMTEYAIVGTGGRTALLGAPEAQTVSRLIAFDVQSGHGRFRPA